MPVEFSIVVPTYNRAALLPIAIRSALAQSFGDFELVIVDDGSTDDTEAVVRAFDDPRIRYLPRANAGVSAARNAGAEAAAGEMLVFLDSDDELLPHALERFRSAAGAARADVVLSGWIGVSADRREWRPFLPTKVGKAAQLIGPYLPGAFALRRDVFVASGGYDEALRFSENTHLGWRVREAVVARNGRVAVVEEPLVARYAPPHRAYDRQRYDAARRILEVHGDALENPVTGSLPPRKRRSIFQAAAGTNAAILGLRAESLRYALLAVRNDPTQPARYRGLLHVAWLAARRRPPRPDGARESVPDARPPRDGDWLVVGAEPSAATDALRQAAVWLDERGAPVGAIGFTGARLDRRWGGRRPLAAAARTGPASVDLLDSVPLLVRADAAAAAGIGASGPDATPPGVDAALRLASAGFALYACSRAALGALGIDTAELDGSRPPVEPPHPAARSERIRERIAVVRHLARAPRSRSSGDQSS